MWSELLLLAACVAPGGGGETGEGDSALARTSPSITQLDWSCDVQDASWAFSANADAWTGGGTLWMARDADRVEKHRVPSTAAAVDGSSDHLALNLSVVADWRYQVSGSSTAWRCSDQDLLSFQLAIYEADGSERADCRGWGADPELWSALDDVPDCDTLLVADTGG